jgi:hypothetical protein
VKSNFTGLPMGRIAAQFADPETHEPTNVTGPVASYLIGVADAAPMEHRLNAKANGSVQSRIVIPTPETYHRWTEPTKSESTKMRETRELSRTPYGALGKQNGARHRS